MSGVGARNTSTIPYRVFDMTMVILKLSIITRQHAIDVPFRKITDVFIFLSQREQRLYNFRFVWVQRDVGLVPIEMPMICWKAFPAK